MSLLPMLVNHNSAFDAALLELTNSRYTIYEHTRMSGENRNAQEMLPLNRHERFSSALEISYACNMAKYFGEEVSVYTRLHSVCVSQQELLSETLLLMQRSIYDKTRISGENRTAHRMLPTNRFVERSDRCSDATDAFYANVMANYFVTRNISPL